MSRLSDMTQNDERNKKGMEELDRKHPRLARVCRWLYRNKLVLSFIIGVISRAIKHYLEYIFEW